jgi:hypothetical protein
MLNVWYIYLQNWVFFGANVGQYSMHGAYGHGKTWGNNRKKCEIQEIPEIHGLVGKVIDVYWTSSV